MIRTLRRLRLCLRRAWRRRQGAGYRCCGCGSWVPLRATTPRARVVCYEEKMFLFCPRCDDEEHISAAKAAWDETLELSHDDRLPGFPPASRAMTRLARRLL